MNRTMEDNHSRYVAPITALLLSSLFFVGCSSSSNDEQPADAVASSVSASAAETSGADSSPLSENSDEAAASSESTSAPDASAQTAEPGDGNLEETQEAPSEPSGSPIALDDAQVTEAQDLLQEAQAALSTAELISAEPEEEEAQEAEGNPELSAETEDKIEAVATGVAADDFLATAYEYQLNGWNVEGSPTFVGEPTISSTTYDGKESKRLEVCVDSSQVKVTDGAGNNMLADNAPTRSRTIYTLVESEGSWKIAAQDFPSNPDC